MKFKLILPTLTMAVPALLPMVSCGPGRNTPDLPDGKLIWEYGDGPYYSKIKAAKEETVNTEKANAEYFHDVANNLNIMADDFMSSEYGNVPGRRDVTYCSFECSVANTEQQLMNVKMDVKITDGEGGEIESSIEFKNFKFLLTFVNNEAVVTPDWKYVDTDNDWECEAIIDERSYWITKESTTGDKILLKEEIFKYCRFKSHYFMNKTISPAQPTFSVVAQEQSSQIRTFQLKEITEYSHCIHVAYEATLTINTDFPLTADKVLVHFKINGNDIPQSWDTWREMVTYSSSTYSRNMDITILDQSFIPNGATIEIQYTIQG